MRVRKVFTTLLHCNALPCSFAKHVTFERAIQYAAAKLRDDREYMLEAMKQEESMLKRANTEIRADREIVLEAVR
ncbi:DUF4116 domain-containing protein [bacterium]|nr:DUF4116 domain-containing protein [bacterium]